MALRCVCNIRGRQENKKKLEKLIHYYERLEKAKYCNIHIVTYFQFLAGKNLAKKMLKEIILFHLPIVGYLIFLKLT